VGGREVEESDKTLESGQPLKTRWGVFMLCSKPHRTIKRSGVQCSLVWSTTN
jgi:hypothetical protein